MKRIFISFLILSPSLVAMDRPDNATKIQDDTNRLRRSQSPSTETENIITSDDESEENGWIPIPLIEPTTPPQSRLQRKIKKYRSIHRPVRDVDNKKKK